jgi:hypothetical protein
MDDEPLLFPCAAREAPELVAAPVAGEIDRPSDPWAEGDQLARAVCLAWDLPRAGAWLSTQLIAALGEQHAWTVTVRLAGPGELGAAGPGGVTGRIGMTGPATWEIVVLSQADSLQREIIVLTLLAHVLCDDVPLGGRGRRAIPWTWEEIRAYSFARTAMALCISGARGVSPSGRPKRAASGGDVSSAFEDFCAAMRPRTAHQALLDRVLCGLSVAMALTLAVWSGLQLGHGGPLDAFFAPLGGAAILLNAGIVFGGGLDTRDADHGAAQAPEEEP